MSFYHLWTLSFLMTWSENITSEFPKQAKRFETFTMKTYYVYLWYLYGILLLVGWGGHNDVWNGKALYVIGQRKASINTSAHKQTQADHVSACGPPLNSCMIVHTCHSPSTPLSLSPSPSSVVWSVQWLMVSEAGLMTVRCDSVEELHKAESSALKNARGWPLGGLLTLPVADHKSCRLLPLEQHRAGLVYTGTLTTVS